MSDSEREKLLAKIRALQNLTTERGCTEAEAMSAAAMVGKLMDQYGFSLSDLEFQGEGMAEETVWAKGVQVGRMLYTAKTIGEYCDCKSWMMKMRDGRVTFRFFGRKSDAQIAAYLLSLCANATYAAWLAHKASLNVKIGTDMRPLRKSFEMGMSLRICERLDKLKAERNASVDDATKRTGGELVVIKNSLVEQEFAKRGLTLKDTRNPARRLDSDSYYAGKRAGDRVAFNEGIEAK